MSSGPPFAIAGRPIGPGHPTYVIAEMSGNHGGDLTRALAILEGAYRAGADAVKLQTYTADTITIDCHKPSFIAASDGPWAGRSLYDLYREASTPWEWQPRLAARGRELGIHVFSSPFDDTSVDFLEREVDVPAYKIASFELVDTPLLQKVAATKKPVIMSTGMATAGEIAAALDDLRDAGSGPVALLHCVSAYPAPAEEMHLANIPAMAERFEVVVGLSDHSLSPAVAVSAVTLGAHIVEKHVTLRRDDGGPDAGFSLEPEELRELVAMIRVADRAVGTASLGTLGPEKSNRAFRKSIYATRDIARGEAFTAENTRVIRPGGGMAPREIQRVQRARASRDIERGDPITDELLNEDS